MIAGKYFFIWMVLSCSSLGGAIISEFMASNEDTLQDEDGDFPDWIEIWNPEQEVIDLTGWFLTDDRFHLKKWVIPSLTIEANERVVIFASGKDRVVGSLHTNFKLASDGEFLGLVAADGITVISSFDERYPEQFRDVSFGDGDFGVGYFDQPTPGKANSSGTAAGPVFWKVTEGLVRPEPGSDLVIEAQVDAAESVELFYRVSFGDLESVMMSSESPSQFRATIPGAAEGELIRWYFQATNFSGDRSRSPAFREPENSPEYFGVVVSDPSLESNAPVIEWFIDPRDYDRLQSFIQPARGGLYFLGEYYDNVAFTIHGQSTAFFDKKSYNIDFNTGYGFRWSEGEKRVKDIDLITNWGDKSKSRQVLAYQMMRDAGVPTHFAISVRVEQNGEFYSVADLIEDADERYLKRAGLNPEGTLYKAYDSSLRREDLGGDDGMVKKTNKEQTNEDLHRFIQGINQEGAERWNYIFDHVDLPMTINTLACLVVNMQTDMVRKNYYLYHDPGDRECWAILPWDMDLSFGRDYRAATGGYFDNQLYFSGYTSFEETGSDLILVRFLLQENAKTKEMFFRRLRTLSDKFLFSNYIENQLDFQLEKLNTRFGEASDAQLDFQKWGSWRQGSPVPVPWTFRDPAVETMQDAVSRIREQWLPARRLELLRNTPELPSPQKRETVVFGQLEINPFSGNQEEEYLELVNESAVAVDISQWSIEGGIRYQFAPGTVIPAGEVLILSPNLKAFRSRTQSPAGGEQHFVVGPYEGKLSNEGETIDLLDAQGELKDSLTFSGQFQGFNGNGRVDQDGDGLSALLEYVMGSSDLRPNAWPVLAGQSFTYPESRNAPDLVLRVEYSEDLKTWNREGVVEVQRWVLNENQEMVRVTLPVSERAQFVRLVVERIQ